MVFGLLNIGLDDGAAGKKYGKRSMAAGPFWSQCSTLRSLRYLLGMNWKPDGVSSANVAMTV